MKNSHVLVGISVLFGGCASSQHSNPWERTDALSRMFPPGKTSADDVLFGWRPRIPDLRLEGNSLKTYWDPKVHARITAVESKSGRSVAMCDRFHVSFDVQCWFFYDENGAVIDTETEIWQKNPVPEKKA